MKLEHSLISYTKINSIWNKDLNVRLDTQKLEFLRNTGRTLFDINHSNIILDPSPRVMEIATQLNKMYLNKLKIFCTAKETISEVKRQPSEWEKIIANETDKELIFQNIQAAHTNQYHENKQPNQKVGKRPKQTFLQRHTDG